jgi:hypothetical protein
MHHPRLNRRLALIEQGRRNTTRVHRTRGVKGRRKLGFVTFSWDGQAREAAAEGVVDAHGVCAGEAGGEFDGGVDEEDLGFDEGVEAEDEFLEIEVEAREEFVH